LLLFLKWRNSFKVVNWYLTDAETNLNEKVIDFNFIRFLRMYFRGLKHESKNIKGILFKMSPVERGVLYLIIEDIQFEKVADLIL